MFALKTRRLVRSSLCVGLSLVCLGVPTSGRAQEFIVSPVDSCRDRLLSELGVLANVEKGIQRVRNALETKADYERLKQELLDDTKYLGLIDARGELALQVGEFAQAVKTKANLIQDLLESHPGFKAIGGLGRTVYKGIKEGREIVEEGIKDRGDETPVDKVKNFVKEEVKKLHPVANAMGNLADNVETIVRMPGEHADFKGEMRGQIDRLDKEIAKAQAAVETAQRELEQKEQLRNSIGSYCDGRPNDDFTQKEEDDPLKKYLDAQDTSAQKQQVRDYLNSLPGQMAEVGEGINRDLKEIEDWRQKEMAKANAAAAAAMVAAGTIFSGAVNAAGQVKTPQTQSTQSSTSVSAPWGTCKNGMHSGGFHDFCRPLPEYGISESTIRQTQEEGRRMIENSMREYNTWRHLGSGGTTGAGASR